MAEGSSGSAAGDGGTWLEGDGFDGLDADALADVLHLLCTLRIDITAPLICPLCPTVRTADWPSSNWTTRAEKQRSTPMRHAIQLLTVPLRIANLGFDNSNLEYRKRLRMLRDLPISCQDPHRKTRFEFQFRIFDPNVLISKLLKHIAYQIGASQASQNWICGTIMPGGMYLIVQPRPLSQCLQHVTRMITMNCRKGRATTDRGA